MNLNLIPSKFIELPHGNLRGELTLEQGKSYGLVGANGIGKSSLIRWCKRNLETEIAYLDQGRLQPLVNLTVTDVINLLAKELKFPVERRDKLFQLFNIFPLFDRKIQQLSGGENQLLKILITFSLDREWYFLDEPFLNLSEVNREKVINLIKEERKQGKCFLIIEHHKELLESIVDKVFEIKGEDGEYHVN